MCGAARSEGALDVAGTVRGEVVVAFAAALGGRDADICIELGVSGGADGVAQNAHLGMEEERRLMQPCFGLALM